MSQPFRWGGDGGRLQLSFFLVLPGLRAGCQMLILHERCNVRKLQLGEVLVHGAPVDTQVVPFAFERVSGGRDKKAQATFLGQK